jgi:hypothetical protein
MLLKVIACEIAKRELQYAAGRSTNVIELQFLPQGFHDVPASGREQIQRHIDAVRGNNYDAIVLAYGLCGKILEGVTCSATRLIIPRGHDCITFFLGSKERYQTCFSERPGTYYFTSGWVESATRRRDNPMSWGGAASPANSKSNLQATYKQWVKAYGEDQANYLLEEISRWTESYSHGCLVDFDFLEPLKLETKVQQICAEKGWVYERIEGDLSLFQRMLDGPWSDSEFLIVEPGHKVVATFNDQIVGVQKL